MNIKLMPHQVMGVSWMVEKERTYFKGGLLFDEMGLGKVSDYCFLSIAPADCAM